MVSVMGLRWRMSWYTRCCATVPLPSPSTSVPWASPGPIILLVFTVLEGTPELNRYQP
jgi:hypothetical protein